MKSLTKQQLINKTAKRTGYARKFSKKIIDAAFDEINESLKNGNTVVLKNIGSLRVENKPERKGFDVRRQKIVKFPARQKIGFHPSKNFRFTS